MREQAGEKLKKKRLLSKSRARHCPSRGRLLSVSLSRLWLAKPINIQFSPGFVMKAAADCALGAANFVNLWRWKNLSQGFRRHEGGTDELLST